MADHDERSYLQLLRKIICDGENKDGRNGRTKSVFGEKLEFNLRNGFPLLTTKNVFWRGVVEELLWFLRGETDANTLIQKGVKIWKDNSTREFLDCRELRHYAEGECGPIYGYQWRCFDGNYPNRTNGMDQVKYILEELRANPMSRRAVLTGWNPKQLHMMCLPPCHVLYNFNISPKNGMSCHMYQRSCDTCAGLPFNIASTALFTHILAAILEVHVDRVIISIGDAHVYQCHVDAAREQVEREPFPFPKMSLRTSPPGKNGTVDDNLRWLHALSYDDFILHDRVCHPSIKYSMIP